MIVSLSGKAYHEKPTVPVFNSQTFRINVELTAEELCRELATGHILVPQIKDITERNGKVDRTTKNVAGRQYVMVDIESDDYDKIPEITPESLQTYSGGLAPTFIYASYSDGVKGHRYHFVWCFDELITDKEANLSIWRRCRTVAKEIVGNNFEDDESVKDMARLCYGSYEKPWFSPNSFRVYNISEFDRIEPFFSAGKNPRATTPGTTRTKTGAPRADLDNIYDKGDHFGYERRQDVIFTLFHSWKDADKVREIYASVDPHRTNPEEGESLIQSAIEYDARGQLYPTSDGLRICRMLNILLQRNDFTKELIYDETLTVNRHISEKYDEVVSSLSKITMIVSEPGSGKTHFSQKLKGNVLVVQMLKAIVDSAKYPREWIKVYENKTFPDLFPAAEVSPEVATEDPNLFNLSPKKPELPKVEEKSLKILCTINKLHHLTLSQLKRFDYIVVDESHIIFEASEYRALGFVFDRFRELCGSDWQGKIILMTGTPILEKKYFPEMKTIRIKTGNDLVRTCTFIRHKNYVKQCSEFIYESIRRGKKVLFPSNRTKVKSQILSRLRRYHTDIPLHIQEFSRPLHYEKENEMLRNKSVIPNDVNILCCTTYLGVGLDIFDKGEWEIVMLNEWTATQIIQFANRLRNKDLHITCFYPDEEKPLTGQAESEAARIEHICDTVNRMKLGCVYDPVRDRSMLDQYNCIVWSDNEQKYLIDPLQQDIYLDWIDYCEFHKPVSRVMIDLGKEGYKVSGSVLISKEEKAEVKRNVVLPEDDNELLAAGLLRLFDANPDFSKDEDVQYIDQAVKIHYLKNTRPLIKRLLKLFNNDDDPFSIDGAANTWALVKRIINIFIEESSDGGKSKTIFSENKFRAFTDSHYLDSHIESYSDLFQKFYMAVKSFVASKELFTKKEIEEFIASQVKCYTTDEKYIKAVEKAIKAYFNIFVERGKEVKKCHKYKITRLRPLRLNKGLADVVLKK